VYIRTAFISFPCFITSRGWKECKRVYKTLNICKNSMLLYVISYILDTQRFSGYTNISVWLPAVIWQTFHLLFMITWKCTVLMKDVTSLWFIMLNFQKKSWSMSRYMIPRKRICKWLVSRLVDWIGLVVDEFSGLFFHQTSHQWSHFYWDLSKKTFLATLVKKREWTRKITESIPNVTVMCSIVCK